MVSSSVFSFCSKPSCISGQRERCFCWMCGIRYLISGFSCLLFSRCYVACVHRFALAPSLCSFFASARFQSCLVNSQPPSRIASSPRHDSTCPPNTAGSNSGIKIEEKQTEYGNARLQHTNALDASNKGRIGYRCAGGHGQDGFNAGSADEHYKAFSLGYGDVGGVGLLFRLVWPSGLEFSVVFFGARAPRHRSLTSRSLRHLSPSSSGW
jgi:hypothetical protein